MGLLKNHDRSSEEKTSEKRSKPPGQAAETIIPEPEGAAEKSVLDALSPGVSGRRTPGRPAEPPGSAAAVTTYLPAENRSLTGGEATGGHGPPSTPAQREAAVRRNEATTFSLHLDAEPTLVAPVATPLEAPDPAQERERIERELGIPELAASLARYGSPPVAPSGKPADPELLVRERLREVSEQVSRWNVGARRSLRDQVREQASRQAEVEDERRAGEQEKLQRELDARWAELRSLRERAARELQHWLGEEGRRRDTDRSERQAVLDAGWRQQHDADPDSLTACLRAAFPEESVTVIGVLDRVAVLIVACPRIDEVIAPTEPAFTSAGRPTLRARTETRRNDLYLSATASHVLAAVGRGLSVTPGITAVSCVAVRPAESGAHRWEPIYVGTFERTYAERLLAEGHWSSDPNSLARAVEDAEDVDLEVTGKMHRMDALDVSADPGLAAVMDQLDPAIRPDAAEARRSDERALRSFLSYDGDSERAAYQDAGHDTHEDAGYDAQENESLDEQEDEDRAVLEGADHAELEDTGRDRLEATETDTDTAGGDVAYLQAQADTAEAGSEGADSAQEEPIKDDSPDGTARPQVDLPGRAGDPLVEALRDNDGFVRRAAVEAIGRRNDPDDTQLLLEALSDRDDYVRLEAMYALKDRMSPDMRRDALVRACSDEDGGVRRKAIDTLAELGDERDLPLLLGALKDRDENVRLEAIYAVKQRLSPNMRDALITACGDVDERVRRKAFEALAELGDERDTPLLLKGLKDSDSSVRLEVIYALEGRTKLGSHGGLSEHLSAAMKDEDPSVRHAAVRLFGRMEQPTTTVPST